MSKVFGFFSKSDFYIMENSIANANIHGHSHSFQLYVTSDTTSVTKFGPETHIASPMNVVTQVFHYPSK